MWSSHSNWLKPKLLPATAFVLLACVPIHAKDTVDKAVLVQFQGQVSISKLAESRPSHIIEGTKLVVTEGMELARNVKVATGADGLALIQLFDGLIIAVRNNSSILIEELLISGEAPSALGKRRAIVDLFAGQLVWDLDPSRFALGVGGIRTPKGIVIPAGTATVRVSSADVWVTAVRGETDVVAVRGSKITVMPGFHLALGAAISVPVTKAGEAATDDVEAAETTWRFARSRSKNIKD